MPDYDYLDGPQKPQKRDDPGPQTDRDTITRAAAAYDKIETKMQKLREQLDEANAHLKAQAKLVEELQLQLSQERNTSSTYRAEAEQARADSTALLTLFANTKALFDGFEIPSERLPMRRKRNGKAAEAPVELPAAASLTVMPDDDLGNIDPLADRRQEEGNTP